MDTLSYIRKVKRFVESQQRKALKRRMDGYNSLARSTSSTSQNRNDGDSPDTIHDISQSLIESIKMRNTRNRFVRRDRIASSVVCDEVRQTWNDKLHAHERLSDEIRQQLSTASISSITQAKQRDILRARDRRLTQLAAWMVFQWTEGEGYDPVKHVRKIEDVYISPVVF